MGLIVHLLHTFFGMLTAVFVALILGAIIGVVLIVWLIWKATAEVVGRAMWGILLSVLLLGSCQRTVYASVVHVSHKKYLKEASKMLKQYNEELVQYVATDHPGV